MRPELPPASLAMRSSTARAASVGFADSLERALDRRAPLFLFFEDIHELVWHDERGEGPRMATLMPDKSIGLRGAFASK